MSHFIKFTGAIGLGLLVSHAALAKTVSVKSPNGLIEFNVSDDASTPTYNITYKGESVMNASSLGLEFAKLDGFTHDLTIKDAQFKKVDTQWEQPWGEARVIRDHHNEIAIHFEGDNRDGSKKTMVLRARAFDDGIGFRYEVPEQQGLLPKGEKAITIIDEKTQFVIPDADKATAWWIPGRQWNRYEYQYNTTPATGIDQAHTPVTFKLNNGVHISIHEAALVDYAAMVLQQQRGGVFRADLTPWSDGARVKTQLGFKTPWRTVQIADHAYELMNSHLILNLNEPNKLGDVDWVEPGKYVGIWWGMHINKNTWGSGPIHGATTSETTRYMDFAAQHGFSGVLVEGWNIGWDGDWYSNGDIFSFTKPYDDFNLTEISLHGEKNNVRLIGHHETSGSVTNYRNQMADAYDLYEKHGVRQVKTGYVADAGKIKRIDEHGVMRNEWHDGQFMVGEYLHSVTEAAKRKISINTHEPIKDTGLRRTYPNWIAREGARGQEYNAWGTPPNFPEHAAILPFTRMLSGPMDYTPGVFNLAPYGLENENRIRSTLAKELSLYVVIYSPIQMVADVIEHYYESDGKTLKPGFQFIKDVPTDWEESRAIAGEVGDYVVVARRERGGDDWYLGALTDEKSRSVSFALDFLSPNKKYTAQIYRDGAKANWQKRPYDLVIEEKTVTAKDTLKFKLAESGGLAIRFVAQ